MERCDDVTGMTYLNDASVLWNLKTRYVAQLIYVSGNAFWRIWCQQENLKLLENKIIFPDLLWFVLRCHQPLQALPHLHQHRGQDVLGQEA